MTTILQKRERLGELTRRIRELADAANNENRDFKPDEQSDWDKAQREFEALEREIKMSESVGDPMVGRRDTYPRLARSRDGGDDLGHPQRRDDRHDGPAFVDGNGNPLRLYRNDERLADHSGDDDGSDFSLGRAIRAAVLGKWGEAPAEQRALAGSIDSSGGFLLTGAAADRVIDGVRAESVAIRGGALTLPMDQKKLTIASIDSDPTATWAAENVSVGDADLTFGARTLRARTLRIPLPISMELIDDAANGAAVIERTMIATLALGLDKAILFGGQDGDAESPIGIRTISGTTVQASIGTPANYDDFSTAVENCLTQNAREPFQMAAHPQTYGTLDRLKDTTNQPLHAPASWERLSKFATTSISIVEGAGSDESFAIVGPFDQIIVGIRQQAKILITPVDGNKFQRRVVAFLRADVVVSRAAYFSVLTGITA